MAWTDSAYDRRSYVRVAVGLRPIELARVFRTYEARTAALEQELRRLRRERTALTTKLSGLARRLADLEAVALQIRQPGARRAAIE